MHLSAHPTAIDAAVTLAAPRWTVFEFLADPLNQCWLTDDWVDVLITGRDPSLAATGISIRNRRGSRMPAELRLLGANGPTNLLMLVDVPRGPLAFVLWEIASANGDQTRPTTTRVHLQVVIQPRGLRDRLRLVAGGARWLRARARLALQELGQALGTEPGQPLADAGLAR